MDEETSVTKPITQSILLTVKKMLGIAEEYHAFDLDIIINVNSVFLTLNQLGVGPDKPFQITGIDEVWSDFLGDQEEFLVGAQSYIYLKTRLLFDPPTNSFLVSSMQDQIKEFEWRFSVQPKNQTQLDRVNSYKEDTEDADQPDDIPSTGGDETDEGGSPDIDVGDGGDETLESDPVTFSMKHSQTNPPSLYDIFG